MTDSNSTDSDSDLELSTISDLVGDVKSPCIFSDDSQLLYNFKQKFKTILKHLSKIQDMG